METDAFGFLATVTLVGTSWADHDKGNQLGPLDDTRLDTWVALVLEHAEDFGIDRPDAVVVKKYDDHGPAAQIEQHVGDVIVAAISVHWQGPTWSDFATPEEIRIDGHHWPGARAPTELTDAALVTRVTGEQEDWRFEPVVVGHTMRSSRGIHRWRSDEGLHTQLLAGSSRCSSSRRGEDIQGGFCAGGLT